DRPLDEHRVERAGRQLTDGLELDPDPALVGLAALVIDRVLDHAVDADPVAHPNRTTGAQAGEIEQRGDHANLALARAPGDLDDLPLSRVDIADDAVVQ